MLVENFHIETCFFLHGMLIFKKNIAFLLKKNICFKLEKKTYGHKTKQSLWFDNCECFLEKKN